jgi:hypothetical protein
MIDWSPFVIGICGASTGVMSYRYYLMVKKYKSVSLSLDEAIKAVEEANSHRNPPVEQLSAVSSRISPTDVPPPPMLVYKVLMQDGSVIKIEANQIDNYNLSNEEAVFNFTKIYVTNFSNQIVAFIRRSDVKYIWVDGTEVVPAPEPVGRRINNG